MEALLNSSIKLGIVGGGQLGKMLMADASRWSIDISCLDKDGKVPAASVCNNLKLGLMTSYDDVFNFGEGLDFLTIESDNVNADALIDLEKSGVKTYPRGQTLKIIQNKFLQREFCSKNSLPTPEFQHYESKESLIGDYNSGSLKLPKIVKTCKSGYDGKGVFLVSEESDLGPIPETELLVEEVVSIKREISVIVARSTNGEVACYPLIELFMRENAYLVDYFISPIDLENEIAEEMKQVAEALVTSLDHVGILAVEFFLDESNRVYINECSPRPHNSGHHTIEGSLTSQYEQHLRAIFGLPLGSCEIKNPAAVVNILGDEGSSGKARYRGLEECLKIPGIKVHVYGKEETKSLRKMGHVTVLGSDAPEVKERVQIVKNKVGVGNG